MEFLKQYQILFKKARTDLKVAKNILEDFENGDEELDLEVVLFHLQQSCEKLLKTLLSYNKIHFTKTHSLEILVDKIKEKNIKLIPDIDTLLSLEEYAIEGRYAILHDDIENVDKYIKILDNLLKFVEDTIEKTS
ncbi:HEPN domain-containing protein [Sulfurospirillum sp. 1307]|jgi:HEPN domain-containing protein